MHGKGSNKPWLKAEFAAFDKILGGATRHEMPLTRTGIEYKGAGHGRKMEQDEFCQKLKP